MKDSSETKEEREKKRKLEETSKGKSTRTSEESILPQREIIDAVSKSDEKMETLFKKSRRKDGQISADNHGFSRSPTPWNEHKHCENETRNVQREATNPREPMKARIKVVTGFHSEKSEPEVIPERIFYRKRDDDENARMNAPRSRSHMLSFTSRTMKKETNSSGQRTC